MTNIVFIEGVSGVGKTTTAVLLNDKLRDMGHNVRCYLEGAGDNPLDPFNGAYPPTMPLRSFSEAYSQLWQNFVKNQYEKYCILILDGTLFHHQINDLIREYNASDEVIINHLTDLLYVIRQLKSVVFYLSSNDVGERLRQARASRKQSVPTEDKITFWENRRRVDLLALNRLSVESHILSIDDGWDTIVEAMADFITTF